MNETNCKTCGKKHRVEQGYYPDENNPFLDYLIFFDPKDDYHFIFALRFHGDEGNVICGLTCSLGDEAVLKYLDELPFEDLHWLGSDSILPRDEVLSSGLDEHAFKFVKILLASAPSLNAIFKRWSVSV